MPDDWKTIRVPKGVYDDAKARKEEHGVTWGEYVNPHAWHSVFDEPKDVGDTALEAGSDLDTEALAAEIRAELNTDAPAFDEIQRAVRTIEERTGRIEQALEDMGARR